MNTVPSSPILAFDPALPQRDQLLDENLMAQYLSPLIAQNGDCEIQHCRRLRTKYRVGASLRVLYEVSGGGRSYRVAARAFPTTHVASTPSADAGVHNADLNTTFWIFPFDKKITNLSVLDHIPPELAKINGRQWIQSRIVGHAPEKSVTAQCLSADKEILAYAKIYAGDEGRTAFNIYGHANAALGLDETDLQIPRALRYSEKHRVLLLESLPGLSLSTLPHTGRDRSFFQLGKALKRLHSISPPSSISKCDRLTPENLAQAAATIRQARPEVAVIVQRLANRLIAQHEQSHERDAVLLHSDVHPKNVLLNGDRLFLLDLDQAAVGVAAIDVGSVIAGLHFDSCVGSLSSRDCSSFSDAFLTGYSLPNCPARSKSLRWHVAATLLLERALRSVSRIRIAGLKKLPEILLAAEAFLSGGN